MAEYTNFSQQEVNANQDVVFTDAPVPCARGFVRHRDGTGDFKLSGWVPTYYGCGCNRPQSAQYLCSFGCNVAIPAGGTVGEVSLGIAIGGSVIPSSIMTVTPSATQQFFNVSRSINIDVWRGCCEDVSVVNLGTESILVQNANIIFTRPDLNITR